MLTKRRDWVKARSRERKKRFIQKILFLVLGLVAFYFFIHSPVFAIQDIVVEGNQLIPPEEILDLAAVHRGANIFQIKVAPIEENLRLNPLVEKVAIRRHLPSTLVVSVKERVPKAMLPLSDGFMVVDSQGVYLRKLDQLVNTSLPIVNGVGNLEGLGLGQRLDNEILRKALSLVDELEPGLLPLLAEINMGEPNQIRFYTNGGIEVRFGDSSQAGEKSRLIRAILAQTQGSQNINYIDISSVVAPVYK